MIINLFKKMTKKDRGIGPLLLGSSLLTIGLTYFWLSSGKMPAEAAPGIFILVNFVFSAFGALLIEHLKKSLKNDSFFIPFVPFFILFLLIESVGIFIFYVAKEAKDLLTYQKKDSTKRVLNKQIE